MKKILVHFADSLISRDQMKSVKGGYGGGCGSGWCYNFSCTCGGNSFTGSAESVEAYTTIVRMYCTVDDGPVACTFSS